MISTDLLKAWAVLSSQHVVQLDEPHTLSVLTVLPATEDRPALGIQALWIRHGSARPTACVFAFTEQLAPGSEAVYARALAEG